MDGQLLINNKFNFKLYKRATICTDTIFIKAQNQGNYSFCVKVFNTIINTFVNRCSKKFLAL